jgi:hypothetical protein
MTSDKAIDILGLLDRLRRSSDPKCHDAATLIDGLVSDVAIRDEKITLMDSEREFFITELSILLKKLNKKDLAG